MIKVGVLCRETMYKEVWIPNGWPKHPSSYSIRLGDGHTWKGLAFQSGGQPTVPQLGRDGSVEEQSC